MRDRPEVEINLADNLFGPKPYITEKFKELLTDDSKIEEGGQLPVRICSYIDPKTHLLRYQLESRGIMKTEDTSRYNDHGINKLDQTEFEKYEDISTAETTQEKIFRLEQAGLSVIVKAIMVDKDKMVVRAQLLPSSHGIDQKNDMYYIIEKSKLYRVFTDPYPNSDPTNIFGVYFNYAISCVIIDLING